MSYAHLFKVGHVTYAICGIGKIKAYDYMRHVLHCKDDQFKYLGKDTRSHQQQFESSTIGVDARGYKPVK